jgi:long-chain acyl-CoA synthetase
LQVTAAAFYEGGWYKTGETGMYDEDGYFFIVDRKKDMIISRGENVSILRRWRKFYRGIPRLPRPL